VLSAESLSAVVQNTSLSWPCLKCLVISLTAFPKSQKPSTDVERLSFDAKG